MTRRPDPRLADLERTMIEKLYGTMDIFGAAYSVRLNGESLGAMGDEGIQICAKSDNAGLDIYVEAELKRGTLHIPTLLTREGKRDKVFNDFHIGEGAEVVIMAGCGIHSDATHLTQHTGVHRFFVGAGARVRYVETHFGSGADGGKRALNPVTEVCLEEGSLMEMETTQIEGVTRTRRVTRCEVGASAKLLIGERIMTSGAQKARTEYSINLNGTGARTSLSSRSVAKGKSWQGFYSEINGNAACVGHSECDAIIMDEAVVKAVPDVTANHVDAQLIHEAAIGKIAAEQILKLMSLGLTRGEAEQKIVDGFLR